MAHINAILDDCASLIPPESLRQLSEEDITVLILAVLLHDIAMHIDVDGFCGLVSGQLHSPVIQGFADLPWPELWQTFQIEAETFSKADWLNVTGEEAAVAMPNLNTPDWSGSQHRLVGEFLRRHHARLGHEIALWGFPSATDKRALTLPSELTYLRDLSGLVARSHGMSLDACRDYLRRQFQDEVKPYGVYVVYLMSLMRVADYIQIRPDRAPRVRDEIQPVRSPISRREWTKHWAIQTITIDGHNPEALRIYARADDFDTQRALLSLFRDIQSELDKTWRVLGAVYGHRPSGQRLLLGFRWILHNLEEDEHLQPGRAVLQDSASRKQSRDSHDARDPQLNALRLVHELKGPLAAIRNIADNMDFEFRRLESEHGFKIDRRWHLDDLEQWTAVMFRQLETFALASTSKVFPHLNRLRILSDVVAPAMRDCNMLLLRYGSSRHGIAISNEDLSIIADKRYLEHAMWHLLQNAIIYSNSEKDPLRVEVNWVRRSEDIAITVRDWGMGIEADCRERVFEEGFRSPQALMKSVGGQGLGLWISRLLIESQGGSIDVTNLKEPTEFTVVMPAFPPRER